MTDERLKVIMHALLNWVVVIGAITMAVGIMAPIIGWALRQAGKAWKGPDPAELLYKTRATVGETIEYETTAVLLCGCETDPEGFLRHRRKGCRIQHPLMPTDRLITMDGGTPSNPVGGEHTTLNLGRPEL